MGEDGQEIRYIQCAMKLAAEYPFLLKEHDRLVKRLDGNWIYTKEMAIADLDNLTVSYDRERVQTSNISNPSERIALMLTDEYMQKKQKEYEWEHQRCLRECEYVDWKLDTIETVIRERMNDFQRRIFKLIFIQGYTFREVKETMPEKICDRKIIEAKKMIWQQISKELLIQEQVNCRYTEQLKAELNDLKERGTDEEESNHTAQDHSGRKETSQRDGQGVPSGKNPGEDLSS